LGTVYAFEGYELDLRLYQLRRGKTTVPLEPQVFDVLAYLVQHHDRMVSKEELLDHVWPERYITEAALNSRLMAARKAIGDSGRDQRLIRTVHGRGYHFVAPVREIHGAVTGAALPAPEALRAPAATGGGTRARTMEGPTTSFVGRERELARLQELLERPSCRLVSVVGPGGVGKTRFALAAGARFREQGRDVAFASLESVREAGQLPAAIAEATGLTLLREDAAADLVAHLGSRQMLLILDNFEQLAAEASPFLLAIVQGAPGVRLLVTSRRVLGLREEWVFSIGGLSTSSEDGEPSEAVRLLLEREAQARADRPPESEELVAVDQICRLVEGMPLALELVASLSRYLTHAQIAEQIARDIEVLSGDLRNVPVRHRSVPGLLEESCKHLSAEELEALLALSVFEGSWAAEASASVAQAPLPLLATLVDHSLVQPHEGRFSLHPLMRQFARQRLGADYERLRELHANYYTTLLAERLPALEREGQVEAIRQMDAEFRNIEAAWRWATQTRQREMLKRAARPLFGYLAYRSRYIEGAGMLRLGRDATEGDGESVAVLADLLVSSAWIEFRLGHFSAAAAAAERASELYASVDAIPPTGVGADPRMVMSVLDHATGNYRSSYEVAERAREAALARGDELGAAYAMVVGASAALRQAELEWIDEGFRGRYRPADGPHGSEAVKDAGSLIGRAGEILERAGEKWLRAWVETERGLQATATGDFRRACRHFEAAYDLRKEFGDPQGMGTALVYLADSLRDLGEFERAEAANRECRQLVMHLGDVGSMSEVDRSEGLLALARGDLPGAAELLSASLERALSIGYATNAVGAVRGLGEAIEASGDTKTAAEIFAFVAAHPATGAFSRAQARAAVSRLLEGAPAEVAAAAEGARAATLEEMAARVLGVARQMAAGERRARAAGS
jgi:DNA-binding winged helix-turn-helix (wHTH) protein/predicted ATPase